VKGPRAGQIHVVAAVACIDGRYLVCRRPEDKRHGGLWEFPGGKVRHGETRSEAVRRELAEELDLAAEAVGDVVYSASDEGSPYVIDFVATVVRGVPVLHEHSEVGWFSVPEMIALDLAPADGRFARWLAEQPEHARGPTRGPSGPR
jgi:mutator protein MutT